MDETTTSGESTSPSTPAASPDPAPAPAPSADRPTSFAAAMAGLGDPATPDPETTPTEPTPAAAIAPSPSLVPATPDTKAPIPFDRHESILKNARVKAEEQVSQKFQAQYGPHVTFGEQLRADPVGTLAQSVAELSEHPDLGPQMLSALARTLASRRGTSRPSLEEPQADLTTADGQIHAYSAEQQVKREAWLRQQWIAEVDQRLAPLQQREQTQQARERMTEATQAADTRMRKVLAPYQALPEFGANRAAIAEKTQGFLADGHDPQTALGLAVTTVLRDVVLPSRAAQQQSTLVAQAVQKSIGSTTVPGATPAAPSARPTSMAEGFAGIQW